jgi:hyperosmotically inducible periplasmic protein
VGEEGIMRTTIVVLTGALLLSCPAVGAAQSSAPPTRDDTAVATEIEHRLSDDRDINAQQIEIDVRDGVVTLRGQTPDDEAKVRAGKLAAAVPGVTGVQNDIGVGHRVMRHDVGPGTILEHGPEAR